MNNWLLRRAMSAPRGPKEYIQFADPAVEAICVQNFSSDGIGVTMQDAAAVTSLGNAFSYNTSIVSFDELYLFSSLNSISSTFYGCTSLRRVTLNPLVTIGNAAFGGCSDLEIVRVVGDQTFTVSGNNRFASNTGAREVFVNNIEQWLSFSLVSDLNSFITPLSTSTNGGTLYINGLAVSRIVIPSSVTTIGRAAFKKVLNIEYIEFHENVTQIGVEAFYPCANLKTVVFRSTTPPTIDSYTFWQNATGRKFYVPYSADHSVLNAYLNAGKAEWGASTVFELNPDGTIPS